MLSGNRHSPTMLRARRQGGDTTLGCALWIVVLLVFAVICWHAIPVKMRTAELHAYMEDQAQLAGRLPAEQIERRILQRAEDLSLPITKKELTVRKTANRIFMEVTYTVPLEFPLYTYNWQFEHKVDLPYFIV